VGFVEGKLLGAILGEVLGAIEGSVLGSEDGRILSVLDGSCDGFELASAEGLGDSVGSKDGWVLLMVLSMETRWVDCLVKH
jgi:hypothetical protein